MEMNGERQINAARATVWAALLSPEVLQECIPGARQVTGTADEGFEAVVVQKVGPVKATFTGLVTLTEMVEQQSLTLSGEGKGGAAGFARGVARVRLEENAGGTNLKYAVEARIGGKLAQLGGRIIDGVAGRLADQFFARLEEIIAGPRAGAPEPEADGKGRLKRPSG